MVDEDSEHIPADDLVDRRVYRLEDRDLRIGAWDQNAQRFVGIALSYGCTRLETAREWGFDPRRGTARAVAELGVDVPPEVPMAPHGPLVEEPRGPGYYPMNEALFDLLIPHHARAVHEEQARVLALGAATPPSPPEGAQNRMTQIDTQYEDLLAHVMASGTPKSDRTDTGTRSVFGHQLRYDLSAGFPLITTKRVFVRGVVEELLWFLRGESNVASLQAAGVRIWDDWADADGELGPVYGVQWRSWPTPGGETVDQITQVIETLRTNPDSRRMVVSAWNVADLDDMALVPCHVMFQFYVADGRLSCQLYQRSADLFLGVPFNIASYALLTHMVAAQAGLEVGDFVWTGGDCHVYDNHVEQVATQLSRQGRPFPALDLAPAGSIDEYTAEHVRITGYDPHPSISAPVAV